MKIKETIGMAAHTYLTHKKITIPASVAIVALIVGGICFGVYSNPQPKVDGYTTTTAKATPEYMSYAKAGTYDSKAHYTSGSISSDGVTISNATFDTLEITSDVGEGTVHLKNVTVNDTLLVNGGGQNSLHLEQTTASKLVENDTDCHIVVGKGSEISEMTVPSSVLVDVYGHVATLNTVPTTETGAVTWTTGINTYANAKIDTLNLGAQMTVSAANGTITTTNQLTADQVAAVQSESTAATTTVAATKNTAKEKAAKVSGNKSGTTTVASSGTTNKSNTNNSNGSNQNANNSNGNNANGSNANGSNANANNSNTNNSNGNNTNTNTSKANTNTAAKTCNHNWVLKGVTQKTVVDVAAYSTTTTNVIPEYNTEALYVCKTCGYQTTSSSDALAHSEAYDHHNTLYQPGTYQTGSHTETIVHDHPAVTHTEDDYTNAYYQCSICGATKPY